MTRMMLMGRGEYSSLAGWLRPFLCVNDGWVGRAKVGRSVPSGLVRVEQRHTDNEGAADPLFAVPFNSTRVELHAVLHDDQAQTCSRNPTDVVPAMKRLEKVTLVTLGNADPAITDGKHRFVLQLPNLKMNDRALGGVFN